MRGGTAGLRAGAPERSQVSALYGAKKTGREMVAEPEIKGTGWSSGSRGGSRKMPRGGSGACEHSKRPGSAFNIHSSYLVRVEGELAARIGL